MLLVKKLSGTVIRISIKTSPEVFSIYKRIIQDMGIGAKTNVGFGMIEEISENSILRKGIEAEIAEKKPAQKGAYYVLSKNERIGIDKNSLLFLQNDQLQKCDKVHVKFKMNAGSVHIYELI